MSKHYSTITTCKYSFLWLVIEPNYVAIGVGVIVGHMTSSWFLIGQWNQKITVMKYFIVSSCSYSYSSHYGVCGSGYLDRDDHVDWFPSGVVCDK